MSNPYPIADWLSSGYHIAYSLKDVAALKRSEPSFSLHPQLACDMWLCSVSFVYVTNVQEFDRYLRLLSSCRRWLLSPPLADSCSFSVISEISGVYWIRWNNCLSSSPSQINGVPYWPTRVSSRWITLHFDPASGWPLQLAEIEVIIGSRCCEDKSKRITILRTLQNNNVTPYHFFFPPFSADSQTHMGNCPLSSSMSAHSPAVPLPSPLYNFSSPLLSHNSSSKMIKRWSIWMCPAKQ